MAKSFVVILIILVLLVGGGAIYLLSRKPPPEAARDEQPVEVTASPTTQPTPSTPEGWQEYSNPELGVSFAVPENFEIENNGKNSVLAAPSEDTPSAGSTRFFYVSVVPKDYPNEPGDIYNYNGPQYRKLINSQVNDRINLSDIEGQEDWFTYERYGDDVFNGMTAKVFVNQRPWEFPNGTWEYRYIFELTEKDVIAGAYIEGGPSDAPFTLPLLTQIMNTLIIF